MISIREAQLGDLEGIERVENASFQTNRFDSGVLAIILTEERFRTWVIEKDGEIFGYATILDT